MQEGIIGTEAVPYVLRSVLLHQETIGPCPAATHFKVHRRGHSAAVPLMAVGSAGVVLEAAGFGADDVKTTGAWPS